jgi:TolA-binding protein
MIMNENTEPIPEPKSPEPVNMPQTNPALVRQQELRGQINQINQRINELRSQQNMITDMIRNHADQALLLQGALNESLRTTSED